MSSSPIEDLGSPDWGVVSSREDLHRKMSSLFVGVGSPVGRKLSSLWVDVGSPRENAGRKLSSLWVDVGSPRENVGRKLSSLWVDVAPHEKLPAELLAEIFVHCTTAIVTLPPKKDEPLLVLTQICSMWRAVALHVPSSGQASQSHSPKDGRTSGG
ncbi:hypothetical protein K438DRAFT_1981102 [Mycena galopus ATCC 62051]|nr:hypothetical protein K438DRAFT_1981102 [Mycena galopus ATCC 62051]